MDFTLERGGQHGLHDRPGLIEPVRWVDDEEHIDLGRETFALQSQHELQTIIDGKVLVHLPPVHVGDEGDATSLAAQGLGPA
mmetsp:Transcript_31229/g.75487  ORF Transcript_31229/g.75487 Transcript_31229/m.75487 type:complete len:82 (+) Transcript_31229:620-865(+)